MSQSLNGEIKRLRAKLEDVQWSLDELYAIEYLMYFAKTGTVKCPGKTMADTMVLLEKGWIYHTGLKYELTIAGKALLDDWEE